MTKTPSCPKVYHLLSLYHLFIEYISILLPVFSHSVFFLIVASDILIFAIFAIFAISATFLHRCLCILFWLATITDGMRVRYHLEKWITSKSHHPLYRISKLAKGFSLCKGNYLKVVSTISRVFFSCFEPYPAFLLSPLFNGLKRVEKYWSETSFCPLPEITMCLSAVYSCKLSDTPVSVVFLLILRIANYLSLRK